MNHSYSILFIILVSIYEYYKTKESMFVFLLPIIIWFAMPSFYYRLIVFLIFCIAKAIQLIASKNILKSQFLAMYLSGAALLCFEYGDLIFRI